MNISVANKESSTIVSLVGRLDSITSTTLEDWINQHIDVPESDLIFDFSQLEYISSAGLRVILNTSKLMKRNSYKFSLCHVQDHVREVFEISGFDSFIPIYTTIDDCIS